MEIYFLIILETGNPRSKASRLVYSEYFPLGWKVMPAFSVLAHMNIPWSMTRKMGMEGDGGQEGGRTASELPDDPSYRDINIIMRSPCLWLISPEIRPKCPISKLHQNNGSEFLGDTEFQFRPLECVHSKEEVHSTVRCWVISTQSSCHLVALLNLVYDRNLNWGAQLPPKKPVPIERMRLVLEFIKPKLRIVFNMFCYSACICTVPTLS